MLGNGDETTLLARERTLLANERNRLANERTFLAWLRTGLASVGGGLAVIRLLTFQNITDQAASQIVGCVLVILGVSMFTLAFFDYKKNYQKLTILSKNAITLWTVGIISVVLIIISLILLVILIRQHV